MFKSVFSRGLACAAVPLAAFVHRQTASCQPKDEESVSNLVLMSGTANKQLSQQIADIVGVKLLDVATHRYSDGELSCTINESIRGKDVFIVQTCAAPVNDNVMELLLTVAAARRAGANNVTTVIPYFGYKYHRRGLPISTTYHSRFLWSAAGDLAKMLGAVGVDNVISVDLQRPGQGHEACFFDSSIPVETISANDVFVDYFKTKINPPLKKVVVVSANTECVKKARKFQKKLKNVLGTDEVDYAVFMRETGSQYEATSSMTRASELLGDVQGADVIIIDDVVETAAQLSVLCRRLVREGAGRVFICASHGLFTKNSMELIDLSPVEKVIVSDSVPLPAHHSSKIEQVSIAPLIAKIIMTERAIRFDEPIASPLADEEVIFDD